MTPDESGPAPVARLEGVRLSYGKTVALAGVTLDIPAGRTVGLLGPDGAGKSSLLSLLAGGSIWLVCDATSHRRGLAWSTARRTGRR